VHPLLRHAEDAVSGVTVPYVQHCPSLSPLAAAIWRAAADILVIGKPPLGCVRASYPHTTVDVQIEAQKALRGGPLSRPCLGGGPHVHPRIRNRINNMGIGMPISHSKTHPTAPRSGLRIALLPCMKVEGRG
jgi:hypothetical protein